MPMLRRGEAETTDRAGLKSQLPSKAKHRVINKLQPVDLVVLYEALNGDGDVLAVMDWVRGQLTRLVSQLQHTPDKALPATPVLRGYYGDRKLTAYREPYRWLACLIDEEIESRVPDAFRQDVLDRFLIIEVDGPKDAPKHPEVEHEQVISGVGAATAGSLADALRAARDPRSDRAQAVLPTAEECKDLKKNAKARAAARAKK